MKNRLIAFDSIHQALHAEKDLLKAGLCVEMIPTPREISASCGQSIAVSAADLTAVLEVISREIIRYHGVYTADFQQRFFEKLD
jgi:hypothetical protein